MPQADWNRRYYEKNKAEYRRRNREIELRNVALISERKSVPCADCGIAYPHYVMDFDHVRGEKLANVSVLARQRVSLRRLEAEIAKCDVVCANCHRERTWGK